MIKASGQGFGCMGCAQTRGFGAAGDATTDMGMQSFLDSPCTVEDVAGDGSIIFDGNCQGGDGHSTAGAIARIQRDNPVAWQQIVQRQRDMMSEARHYPGQVGPPAPGGAYVTADGRTIVAGDKPAGNALLWGVLAAVGLGAIGLVAAKRLG